MTVGFFFVISPQQISRTISSFESGSNNRLLIIHSNRDIVSWDRCWFQRWKFSTLSATNEAPFTSTVSGWRQKSLLTKISQTFTWLIWRLTLWTFIQSIVQLKQNPHLSIRHRISATGSFLCVTVRDHLSIKQRRWYSEVLDDEAVNEVWLSIYGAVF